MALQRAKLGEAASEAKVLHLLMEVCFHFYRVSMI